MKANKLCLFFLLGSLLVLTLGAVCFGASETGIELKRKKDIKDGYTCTTIYHKGEVDEGYAGAKATNCNYIIVQTALGQGITECTDARYLDKLATGSASYYLKGSPINEYHFFEPSWYTNLGTAMMGASKMKVTVCYAEMVRANVTYHRLTEWVTDK